MGPVRDGMRTRWGGRRGRGEERRVVRRVGKVCGGEEGEEGDIAGWRGWDWMEGWGLDFGMGIAGVEGELGGL